MLRAARVRPNGDCAATVSSHLAPEAVENAARMDARPAIAECPGFDSLQATPGNRTDIEVVYRQDLASAFGQHLKGRFDRRDHLTAPMGPFDQEMPAFADAGARQKRPAEHSLAVKNAAPLARIKIERAVDLVPPDIGDLERHLGREVPDPDRQTAQVMRLRDARVLALRPDSQPE